MSVRLEFFYTKDQCLALTQQIETKQSHGTCPVCRAQIWNRDSVKKRYRDVDTRLLFFITHHYQNVHNISADRPHKCISCKHSFLDKAELTIHERTHSSVQLKTIKAERDKIRMLPTTPETTSRKRGRMLDNDREYIEKRRSLLRNAGDGVFALRPLYEGDELPFGGEPFDSTNMDGNELSSYSASVSVEKEGQPTRRYSIDPEKQPLEQRTLTSFVNDAGPLFANVELITKNNTHGVPQKWKLRVTKPIPPQSELYLMYGEEYWKDEWKEKLLRWTPGSYPKDFVQFEEITQT